MARRVISKKLGQLLIDRGVIDAKQLEIALSVQQEKGGLIGQIIVALGYATEEEIAQAITAQYGFPYLPLANYEVDPEVVKIIPKNVSVQFCLMPVDKIGSTLTIAMSDPLNSLAVEDIELVSGLSVQIFVSTGTDIKNAIEKYYNQDASTNA